MLPASHPMPESPVTLLPKLALSALALAALSTAQAQQAPLKVEIGRAHV